MTLIVMMKVLSRLYQTKEKKKKILRTGYWKRARRSMFGIVISTKEQIMTRIANESGISGAKD